MLKQLGFKQILQQIVRQYIKVLHFCTVKSLLQNLDNNLYKLYKWANVVISIGLPVLWYSVEMMF